MKNQHIIASKGAHTRITNLIASKIKSAVSIFSSTPTVEVEDRSNAWQRIVVKNEESHILTFAEIDTVREVVDEFCKKYKGMFYIIGTRPYLASDNKTWLHMPVMEINVRKYDFNHETKSFE